MRVFLLVLLLPLAGGCLPKPAPGPTSGQGMQPPVSIQFFIVHEQFGENIVEHRIESTGDVVLLAAKPDLTERDIAWARLETDRSSGRASVLVHFTHLGRDNLAMLTRQNLGRRLAIVVDGKVLSAPLIRGEIRDGRASIRGFQSAAEARRVADALARR